MAAKDILDAADHFFLRRYGRPQGWEIMLDERFVMQRVVRLAMKTSLNTGAKPCGLVR